MSGNHIDDDAVICDVIKKTTCFEMFIYLCVIHYIWFSATLKSVDRRVCIPGASGHLYGMGMLWKLDDIYP